MQPCLIGGYNDSIVSGVDHSRSLNLIGSLTMTVCSNLRAPGLYYKSLEAVPSL
jgi:hypothetical protein